MKIVDRYNSHFLRSDTYNIPVIFIYTWQTIMVGIPFKTKNVILAQASIICFWPGLQPSWIFFAFEKSHKRCVLSCNQN